MARRFRHDEDYFRIDGPEFSQKMLCGNPLPRCQLLGLISLVVAATVGTGEAHACEAMALTATFRNASTFSGEIRCQGAPNSNSAKDIAVFHATLLDEPALDDVGRPLLYPDGFDAGELALFDSDSRQAIAPAPWLVGRGRLAFEARVPKRADIYGRVKGATYALAGWHPTFGDRESGRLFDGPIHYRITLPHGGVALVGERLLDARGQTVEGTHLGSWVPILLAPRIDVEATPAGPLLLPQPEHHAQGRVDPPWNLRDLSTLRDEHVLKNLRATTDVAKRFAERAKLDTSKPLVLIQAPLRDRFSALFDGGLVVSDRAFLLLNFELFLGFHRLALWRSLLASYAYRDARERESELPPRLVADAVAVAIRDKMELELFDGGKEDADRLLDRYAVIPEIDSLVYAPQIAIPDALFEAIDERTALRLHPDDFYHDRPRGKLLYAKLSDRLGADHVRRTAADYGASESPFLDLWKQADARAILAPWLGPHPRFDYLLEDVETDTDTGKVTVTVGQRGPDSVVEPVTVYLRDAKGEEHEQTRLGPGSLTFEVPGPPQKVIIDPHHRLVELAPPEGRLARWNNTEENEWRFLLNNILGVVAVTNQQLSGQANFGLRRLNDLRYGFTFDVYGGPTGYGLSAGGYYNFGKQLTPLRLAESLGISMSASKLRIDQGTGSNGYVGSLGIGYSYNDRNSIYYAFRGTGFSTGASVAGANLDTGENQGWTSFYSQIHHLFPFGFHNALLLRLRGNILFGQPVAQGLLRLGSRTAAGRGYETTELFGRQRVVATAEHRHALALAERTDFFGLLMWTRLEGALFADAVYLPNSRADCGRDVFFDVGYSLRFIGDVLNVSPKLLSVDIGIPLNRCENSRYVGNPTPDELEELRRRHEAGLGPAPSRRPPLIVNITFTPAI